MRYILTLLLIASQFLLKAQEELTLKRAIAIGLENNYQIKIADNAIRIAENNDTWARAGRLPTIDLNGSFSNNIVQDNNPASFLQGTYYTGSLGAGADVNWVVYNGGRIQLRKDQLGLAIGQEQLSKDADIHSLLRSIYQQYYEVIFQEEQLDVLDQVLSLSQDRLEYEEVKREFGSSNTYNLLQFKTAILTDTNRIVSQIQSVETAKRNLYKTLNLENGEEFAFEERLSTIPEQIDLEKMKALMNEENYTIKTLQILAKLNQFNTGLARAARKPTLSLNGSVGFSENAFKFFGDSPNTGEPIDLLFSNRLTGAVNAVLTYNLYDGGVKKVDIQNAKLQEEIDQLTILEAKAELNNQLGILVDNYSNQIDLLKLADKEIALSQENLTITEERFKAGQLTSLDYRNVQNLYLNAAYNKVGAIYSLLVTKSEIDFLVGIFGE